MKPWISLTFIAGIAFFICACASKPHQISDESLEKGAGKGSYSNLLLLGAYDDRQYRVGAEALFAEVLKEQGIKAAPSYDILPALKSLKCNEEVAEKLKGTEYDAVLIVTALYKGYDYDLGDYYATKGFVYLLGGRPGPATELGSLFAWAGSGGYRLYVGLWDAATLKPIREVTTDSETTGSDTEDNKALAKLVAGQLYEQGLIKLQVR